MSNPNKSETPVGSDALFSDTPETDANLQWWRDESWVHHTIARKLERERDELKRDLKEALSWIADDYTDDDGRALIVDPMRAKHFPENAALSRPEHSEGANHE